MRPHSTVFAERAARDELRTIRLLSLLAALIYPLFSPLATLIDSMRADPIAPRLVLSAYLILVVAASYRSAWLRARMPWVLLIAGAAMEAHYSYLLVTNEIEPITVMAMVIGFALINTTMVRAYLLVTHLVVAVSIVVCVIGLGLTLGLVDADGVRRLSYLAFMLVLVGLTQYLALSSQFRLRLMFGASESRIARLSGLATEGIAVHENGVIVDANQALATHFGCTADALIGRSLTEFVASDDAHALRALLSADPAASQIGATELTIRRVDGQTFRGEVGVRGVQAGAGLDVVDPYGRKALGVALVRNVEARYEAQRAMARLTKQLQALIQNLQIGVLFEDADRRVVYANQALCDLFGIKRLASCIGADAAAGLASVAQRFHKPATFIEDTERTVRQGVPVRAREFRMVDGRILQRDHVPVRYDNEFSGILWVCRDVTEQRRAEEQLRKSEARFRAIYEQAGAGICIATESGRILEANPALTRMLGVDLGQLKGKRIVQLLARGGRAALDENLAALRGGRMSKAKANASFRRKNAPPLEASVVVTVLRRRRPDHADDEGLIVALIEDIGQRNQIQRDLARARDEAIESTRLKSEFLANMSHEIRTPINAIVGMAGLLMASDLDARERDYTQTIWTSADALTALISDILDFSKIEAGKLTLESMPFDLTTVLEESFDIVTSRDVAERLELAFEIDPNVPETLVGDPARLRQIVTNLLANAVKFTADGEVRVQVERVETPGPGSEALRLPIGQSLGSKVVAEPVGAPPAADRTAMEESADSGEASADRADPVWIAITVHDTGIGIAPDEQGGLFAPFVQADGSMTRRYGGTGLGLAICRQIVHLMDGSIEVTSELGRGSAFRFTVALREAPADTPELRPNTAAARAVLNATRLLVCDDNATTQRIVCEHLRACRAHVTETTCVADLLQAARTARAEGNIVSGVLLDADLTGAKGQSGLAALRDDEYFRGVPVVLLAALPPDLDEGDIDGEPPLWVTKPVSRDQLYATLAQSLGLDASASTSSSLAGLALAARGIALGGRPMDVLVVEDNAINQKVVLAQLSLLGVQAVAVADGGAAITAASERPYDLVLMDCQMPNVDGYTATREIRARGIRTPIVALTAHATEADRERAIAAGMTGHLTKPLDIHDLLDTLVRWADRIEDDTGERVSIDGVPAGSAAERPTRPLATRGGRGVKRTREIARRSTLVDMVTPNKPPVLDKTILHDWFDPATEAGQSALQEVVELFRTHSPPRLAAITSGLSEADWDLVREQAHALRGSAANIGAKRLDGIAGIVEEISATLAVDARAGRELTQANADTIRSTVDQLRSVLDRTVDALDELVTS